MNDKERDAVNTVKNQSGKQQSTRQQTGNGRVRESATTAGNSLQDKLTLGRAQLKNNIKKQIVAGAIADVAQDFANGDFGELSEEMLDELFMGLNRPLEIECQVLTEWQDSPKLALMPAPELSI